MSTIPDLRGMKFNRLSPFEYKKIEGDERGLWSCLCECGSVVRVRGNRLLSGHTKSCGCFHREIVSKTRFKDVSGQKFGRLTAIRPSSLTGRDKYKWVCRCDCGNETLLASYLFTSGTVKSCGCWKREVTTTKNTKHGLSKTKEYKQAKGNKRRAMKAKSVGCFSKSDIDAMLLLQKGKCAICKTSLRGKFDVDHVDPLSKGGSNGKDNIQILCPRCNRRKSNKDPVLFMQENGFLI